MVRSSSRFHAAAFSLAALTSACNGDSYKTSPTAVDNPKGTIGGLVEDVETEMPIANASVTLVTASGALTAMTDATGFYSVPQVPVGPFVVQIAATGYQSAELESSLQQYAPATGLIDNPSGINPIVALFKPTGTFAVRTVGEDGTGVPNVSVDVLTSMRYFTYSYGSFSARGSYTVHATSDATGLITISGLPDYATLGRVGSSYLSITVPPVADVSGTAGAYDYAGGQFSIDALAVAQGSSVANTNTPILYLGNASASFTILDSNVEALRTSVTNGPIGSIVAPDAAITVAFNQTIDPSSVNVVLREENDAASSIALTIAVNGNLLTITPGSLVAGRRYTLTLAAAAASSANQTTSSGLLTRTVPIFTAQPAALAAPTPTYCPSNSPAAGRVRLRFNDAIGLGNGTNSAVPCLVYWVDDIDEMSSTPPTAGQVAYPTCNGAAITYMRPVEESSVVSGFSTLWELPNPPAFPSGLAAKNAELIFGRQVGTSLMRHASGVVIDDPTAGPLSFTIPTQLADPSPNLAPADCL